MTVGGVHLCSAIMWAYISDSGSLGVVQEGDQVVGGVRDGGAEDSGDVAAPETDSELERFAALVLRRGDEVLVGHLHDVLVCRELHHGVCTEDGEAQFGRIICRVWMLSENEKGCTYKESVAPKEEQVL
jgi:hypothetical protein